ncbi:MAG: PDZ domain-containing protein [Deltaproteobacteria bacterium]|nr:PDZ domain-containing protein [Deltaproteobacteria bacterium]
MSTKYYLWLAHLLILGLIVWAGVNLGTTLLAHRLEDRARDQSPVKVAANLAPRLHSLTEYETIVRDNMFAPHVKETAASTAPATVMEPEVQTEKSEFKLKGTIISKRPELSYAVLETAKSRKQDLFRTGDKAGDAELVQINPGEVLLRENGKIQRLTIVEPESKPHSRYQKARTAKTVRTEKNRIAQAVGLNKYVVSREILNQDITDLYSFMSQINIQPYKKNGNPHGFRVSRIRPNSVFYQLGLRNNDVIVKLNGVAIRQPEDVMGLYQQVQELDSVTLEVERRGRPTTFTYSLR